MIQALVDQGDVDEANSSDLDYVGKAIEGRSPKSGHRMAAEGMPFPWRWNGSTISTDLDVIWGMSV